MKKLAWSCEMSTFNTTLRSRKPVKESASAVNRLLRKHTLLCEQGLWTTFKCSFILMGEKRTIGVKQTKSLICLLRKTKTDLISNSANSRKPSWRCCRSGPLFQGAHVTHCPTTSSEKCIFSHLITVKKKKKMVYGVEYSWKSEHF